MPTLALAFAAVACKAPRLDAPVGDGLAVDASAVSSSAPPAQTATSDAADGGPARLDVPAVDPLAASSNAFALDLYANLRRDGENLVFSPWSISTGLLMATLGARGETAAQMAKVLHLTDPDRAADAESALLAGYGALGAGVTLRVANRLFGDKRLQFEPSYLARLQAAFGAPLEPVDFLRQTEGSRLRINAWVSAQTEGQIKHMVPPSALSEHTLLALVDAIYLVGSWKFTFPRYSTHPRPFFTSATVSKDVPTMHAHLVTTGEVRLAESADVAVVELPYLGGVLAMDFVVPSAKDGLAALEARLTGDALEGWLSHPVKGRIFVAIPRFELAPKRALSIVDALKTLGMPIAFDRDKADFSGMAKPGAVYLSEILQEAHVKVDEQGTKAEGALVAFGGDPGDGVPEPPEHQFHADRPFLFLLRDVRSGLILFMGRVVDPTAR